MLVTLISKKKIFALQLPVKVRGRFSLVNPDLPSWSNTLLTFEAGNNDKWISVSDNKANLFDENGAPVERIEWEAGNLYPVEIKNKYFGIGHAFILFEDDSSDKNEFRKYRITRDSLLKIGRSSDSQIIIANPHVSGSHALLIYQGGAWSVSECEGTNGTYLNGSRITSRVRLSGGDMIYILGVRIIIGSDYIAINNPGETVTINAAVLEEYHINHTVDEKVKNLPDDVFFYRSPRFIKHIVPVQMSVDAPTKQIGNDDMPILFTIGPSLMMGVAAFATGIISFINARNNGGNIWSSIPMLFTSVSMLVGMIVFPFIMRKIERRKKVEKEAERKDKYRKYLANIDEEITGQCIAQTGILRDNSPNILEYTNHSSFWERRLWERSQTDEDFLKLRLGLGNVKMIGEIKFPQERFGIEDDVLKNELKAFQAKERLLYNIPVCFPLKEGRILGIVGERESRMMFLNNLLLQICLLHSYDEVKLICLYDESDEKYLSYIKYAQHVWDDEGKTRYIAINEEDTRQLSINVSKIVLDSVGQSKDDGESIPGPHYIIVSTSKIHSNKCTFMSDVCSENMPSNFSIICAYDSIKDLPKECKSVLEVHEAKGVLTTSLADGQKVGVVRDEIRYQDAAVRIHRMASETLDLNHGKYELPKMITFMDMLGTGKIEYLNILQRWKKNDPIRSLKAPVGVDTNGEIFYLDLHEKVHGPHGLVAGMTGSGKSEFIITYILAMAVNYHPDEVAFVLIDYKGGGLAGAFDNEKFRLPHLAGTITNLDSSAVTRSILSISSELKRRQKIFNEARVIANEGTMDIYKYQKMFREGLVKDPLPHLFIISDEFAELKSQQPEFMDQLISTARIGRSLGVHLILATQKPSGVVNEQIWANSRFKVCLKVQDRADSMDMLKRPDAASISETGRFFLQVGYNELFELGQSAWAGALYTDSDSVSISDDLSIEVIDNLGGIYDTVKPVKTVETSKNGKQIVRIMEYLDKLARDEEIKERQLWMPELEPVILYDDIVRNEGYTPNRNSFEALVGMLDDPYRQDQRMLSLSFTDEGNTIIYDASGSGSEMMLETILYSLYSNYSADDLRTVILDFGSESLSMFAGAPNTDRVIVDGDTDEIIDLFATLKEEVSRRKKLLSQYGGDLQRYLTSGEEKIPYMLVVLNNLSSFVESNSSFEESLISITRDCIKYGIYFIVTANSSGAVRYRLSQNFPKIFVLQLNDITDYTSILSKTGGIYPPNIPGRGIISSDEIYIYQTASIVSPENDLFGYVTEFCSGLGSDPDNSGKNVTNSRACAVTTGTELANEMTGFDAVPIGYSVSGRQLLYVDMVKNNILHAISKNGDETIRFAAGMCEMLEKVPGIEIVVINGGKKAEHLIKTEHRKIDIDVAAQEIERLILQGIERNNSYKKENADYSDKPCFVVINCIDELKSNLSKEDFSNLSVMLQKVEGFTGMYFLVTGRFDSVNKYSAADWYLDRVNGTGLCIGGSVNEQNWLRFAGKADIADGKTGTSTGYYVHEESAVKIYTVAPTESD